ncbi:uncharacterized protein LOC126982144 [Eriocheir sinensis]|uniref:uncharacterized protein LOC126982144 n=1 Tax=Eriocheir sinensis TaxID=95602 RepID=UPI0021C69BFC|nr:uncharacterized protein LOC126982144 [Eriocheir sinensis]
MTVGGVEACIRVGCIMFMPHMIVTGNGTHPVVSGTLVEFFETVGKKLGRCVQYIAEPTNEAGIELPNGTWTGVMGVTHRNETDVTTMLIMSLKRAMAFDFSDFLYIEEHSASYKRPVLESDISGFIKPFSPLVSNASSV